MTATSEDGDHSVVYDFRTAPGPPRLRRQLVAAFAKACGPAGTLRRPRSWRCYAQVLRRFLVFAAEQADPVSHAGQVTPGVWARWLLAHPSPSVSDALRRLLRLVDDLPALTRAAMDVRRRTVRPTRITDSYSREEFTAIRTAARHEVRRIEQRIAAGAQLLDRLRAGELPADSDEGRLARLLDDLARTGDLARYPSGAVRPEARRVLRTLPRQWHSLLSMLYPTPTEVPALAVLLICEQGWNLSVVQEMTVPDLRPDGGVGDIPIHRAEIVKPRRPARNRYASNNLADLGPGTSGRAMAQVVSITDPVRQTLAALGRPTRRLLVARQYSPSNQHGPWTFGCPDGAISHWGHTVDPLTARQLVVSARRLRRTHQVLFGGTRQNSQHIHEDVYLLPDLAVRAQAADVVAAGLHEAVDHAANTVRMRVLATGTPPQAEASGLSATQLDDVRSGRLDTATGACLDFAHSPISGGGACTASFLLCFACPNAVAVARHLPRIVYLHDALTAMRAAVSSAVWSADWSPHYARVSDLLDRHTAPAERDQYRAQTVAADRQAIDALLRRRLDP